MWRETTKTGALKTSLSLCLDAVVTKPKAESCESCSVLFSSAKLFDVGPNKRIRLYHCLKLYLLEFTLGKQNVVSISKLSWV